MYLSDTINRIKSLNRLSNAPFAMTINANANKKTSVAQSLFSMILGCSSSAIMDGKITKFYLFRTIIILLRFG
jgi:hypothetical protein